ILITLTKLPTIPLLPFTQTIIPPKKSSHLSSLLTQTERHALLVEGINGKTLLRPIISIQSWRIGILFFAFGNALNFISFGYAAQSLLAALGSIQFVSNIAFSYFVLQKTVTVSIVLVATTFIVLGNIFLVAFGNHQSPVYTQEQLAKKYSNITFLFYCLLLVVVVLMHHYVYRRGELLLAIPGKDLMRYWKLLLPFSVSFL
ncbi:probable magnesium transporter NIPA8, partial [Lactuca sativa]|uniref:probable magnesium transporter NIPA8 n=1 Tax=Lactuca sativa TaxID=4236 RepID=UPI0022AE6F63